MNQKDQGTSEMEGECYRTFILIFQMELQFNSELCNFITK